jgi:TonB family protein
MPITRVIARLIFIGVVLASSYRPIAKAQTEFPEINSFADLLRMMASQPDHMADWTVVINEEKFGIHLNKHFKFAKKQGQTRQEFYPLEDTQGVKKTDRSYRVISISQQGQPPLAFDPQALTYSEMPDGFRANPLDIDQLLNTARQVQDQIKVQNLGTVTMEGHQSAKICMTITGEGEIFFYFAKDLRNLLIRIDSGNNQGGGFSVSNVSFEVPDDLFQIPKNYRKVDFNSFMLPLKQRTPTARPQKDKSLGQGIPGGIPGPPPSSQIVPRISGDAADETQVDTRPLLLSGPKPDYTSEARKNEIQGNVIARLLVDATGKVQQVKIVAGLPDGLNEEAMKAAYQQKYRPAMKDGHAVGCWIRVEIEFRLERK